MDERKYIISHKEVQRMTRIFFEGRGWKVVTKRHRKKVSRSIRSFSGENRSIFDDVFAASNGEEIICEYKPSPVVRQTIMTGIGEALVYSAESGLRSYLVISETDYLKFIKAINKLSILGLLIYEDGEIKRIRRPVDIDSLPKPNKVLEVSLI